MGLKNEVLVKQGGNLVICSSATEILRAVNMLEELARGEECGQWGQGSSAAAVPSPLLMVSQEEVRYGSQLMVERS